MFREASAYEKVMKQSEAPPSHREESNPHLWIKTRMLEKDTKKPPLPEEGAKVFCH